MYQAILGFYFGDDDYSAHVTIESESLAEIRKSVAAYYKLVKISQINHNGFCQFIYERDPVPQDIKKALAAMGYDENCGDDESDDIYYDGPMDKFNAEVLGFEWPYKEGEYAFPSGSDVTVQVITDSFTIPDNSDAEPEESSDRFTVQDLINRLNQIENKNRIVIISSDIEGNNYSPLYKLWEADYQAENSYSGIIGHNELTDEDKAAGYTNEDLVNGEPALVLVPTN